MLKTTLAIAALMLLMLLGLLSSPPPSVGNMSEDSLSPSVQAQLEDLEYPASLLWVPAQQTWLVGSLSPQTVLKNGSAQLSYYSSNFQWLKQEALPTGGDLSDLSLVNDHLLAINENGKLLFFTPQPQGWHYAHKRRWLKGGLRHKTAALAWDEQQQKLYTCEQEGLKRCYQGNREATVEREFELSTGDAELDKKLLQLTISSMAFHQGKLYALSEQYHQLLLLDPQLGFITQQWNLQVDGQVKAIASNGDNLWLLSVIREQSKQATLSIIF